MQLQSWHQRCPEVFRVGLSQISRMWQQVSRQLGFGVIGSGARLAFTRLWWVDDMFHFYHHYPLDWVVHENQLMAWLGIGGLDDKGMFTCSLVTELIFTHVETFTVGWYNVIFSRCMRHRWHLRWVVAAEYMKWLSWWMFRLESLSPQEKPQMLIFDNYHIFMLIINRWYLVFI